MRNFVSRLIVLCVCLAWLSSPSAAKDAVPPFAEVKRSSESPLHFDEVLQSVRLHDPRIHKVLEEVRRVEATHLSARGGFDPRLRTAASATIGGYYNLRRFDAELSQSTTLWGSEIFVGYRLGQGDNGRWPTYYSDLTREQGEWRAGVRVPLLRDGPIDAQRAARLRTKYELDGAEFGLQNLELDLEVAAAQAYFRWLSAGKQLRVAEDMVKLAVERDAQLRMRYAAGSIAEFDVIDNERILLERRDFAVAATRALEQAALRLSLFLRSNQGEPVVPSRSRVPKVLPQLSDDKVLLGQAMSRVLRCHPEFNQRKQELRAAEVNLRLAKNRLAPELSVSFQVSQDLGESANNPLDITLGGTVYDATLNFSMPLLMRSARGDARAARARVAATQAEIEFLENRLRMLTSDSSSALAAAKRRATLTREVVDTSERLAHGERRRFEAGSSNLIFVNLREQTAAAARIRFVGALAQAKIAQTRWRVTTLEGRCSQGEISATLPSGEDAS